VHTTDISPKNLVLFLTENVGNYFGNFFFLV
jgi:hypothetical protein